MSLQEELGIALQAMNHGEECSASIIPLIDLTWLEKNATDNEVEALSFKGEEHQVASVCVFPEHLDCIPRNIKVKRTSVINFPSGDQSQSQVIKAVENIIGHSIIHELDYVFSYQKYLNGQSEEALLSCQKISQLCNEHQILFKVILETGAFSSIDAIYQASVDVINYGCDFLKTSTGKISIGATLPAAFAMLSAIKTTGASCGLKVSGGIKTKKQAQEYIHLYQYVMRKKVNSQRFRIGASTLLDELIQTVHACKTRGVK